jgi:diguanylate cyclase (GGDEF)-like protein
MCLSPRDDGQVSVTPALGMVEENEDRSSSVRSPLPARRLPPPWLCFLGTGLALMVAAVSGSLGAFEPVAVFTVGISALIAMVLSIRRNRPSVTWPWWSISTALALFLVAGLARIELNTLGNLTASRSLVPDFIALPGYILLALGLFGFARASGGGRQNHIGIALDGLIAALAILSVAWVFVIGPELFHRQTPLDVRFVLTCYPAMSIFLVVVTLRIAFNPEQERVPAYWLLVAAMTCMFVGDTLYMFADIDLLHVPGRLLDLPYGLAYVVAGALAIHVSMRKLTEPAALPRQGASRGRILVVAIALLIPAVLALHQPGGRLSDRVVLFSIIVVLAGAAVLRITQALNVAERSEALMAYQAMHDHLTGLPNRRMMNQHLTRLLKSSVVDDTHVALLFLDLDRFKLVNDTLGHTHGDELLIGVAERLKEHVRENDLITRIGGDEFMITLSDVVSVSQALDMANRLRSCLRSPFMLNGMEFYVSASVGLAFASGDDPEASAEVLVREADIAMYQAKEAGRDSVAVFDESMRTRVSERVELEHDLRFAVELRQLHLVYQPILRLPHGPIEGFEALVRWSHPTLGVIPPLKFIPIAEETGLIVDIGNWVLEEALRQLASWHDRGVGMQNRYVAVNLSAAQLRDDQLVPRVSEALDRYGLNGTSLCLELTESCVMEDLSTAVRMLTELRALDIQLAIDDFGTEYSSLAYLKRFPVTSLKIDRSFVANLDEEDSSDATLITAVVAMARALGIATIAEGVETASQAERVVALGCDSVQGYFYSRPVRAELLPEVIDAMWQGDDALEPASR